MMSMISVAEGNKKYNISDITTLNSTTMSVQENYDLSIRPPNSAQKSANKGIFFFLNFSRNNLNPP